MTIMPKTVVMYHSLRRGFRRLLVAPLFRFPAKWGPCFLVAFGIGQISLYASPLNLRGSLGIHDPSAIIQCNGRYYVFGTGQGIISKSSADKTYWVTGPSVF